MDTANEMSWEDACTALRLGARPEEVVSRARALFRDLPPSPPPEASSPPTPPPPGVEGLYRTIPEAGDATLQLCFLRPPLQVLEAAEREPVARDTTPQLDTELTFDVLSLFEPRLIAPIDEKWHGLSPEALVTPREPGPSTALVPVVEEPVRPRDCVELRALGEQLATGTSAAKLRTLNVREWAVAYPAFARAAIGDAAGVALRALRDVGSEQLGWFVLQSVVPMLLASGERKREVDRVVAAAANAASMDKCSVADVKDLVLRVQDAGGRGRSNEAMLNILEFAMGVNGG